MNKIRAITVSGEVSSGKSTISAGLIHVLPEWHWINTGQMFRDFLNARGESVQRVSFLPDDIHKEFDLRQRIILEQNQNVIVEGRLSGWIARDLVDVFKVFCNAPYKTRLLRYMQREKCTMDKAIKEIKYRDARDAEKFRLVYGVQDYRSPQFYDLQVDTGSSTPLDIAKLILKEACFL